MSEGLNGQETNSGIAWRHWLLIFLLLPSFHYGEALLLGFLVVGEHQATVFHTWGVIGILLLLALIAICVPTGIIWHCRYLDRVHWMRAIHRIVLGGLIAFSLAPAAAWAYAVKVLLIEGGRVGMPWSTTEYFMLGAYGLAAMLILASLSASILWSLREESAPGLGTQAEPKTMGTTSPAGTSELICGTEDRTQPPK